MITFLSASKWDIWFLGKLCMATWLVRYRRTEEEQVRCFLVRNTTSGQLVAQSADATCHGGLLSPADGHLTFNMTPAEARQGCTHKYKQNRTESDA